MHTYLQGIISQLLQKMWLYIIKILDGVPRFKWILRHPMNLPDVVLYKSLD